MEMDDFSIAVIFVTATLIVLLAVEIGVQLGRFVLLKGKAEKEGPVSAIAATILGILSFMLVFTFGIVADRHFDRVALVRNEANAIRTAWLRSDFLPDSARSEVKALFLEYVDARIARGQSRDLVQIQKDVIETNMIQRKIWNLSVANARKDTNWDFTSLYIEALNEMINVQSQRLDVGLQTRVPGAIWQVLMALFILGMVAIGYQNSMSLSRRSLVIPLLALSFSLVITMIVELDRPINSLISVSQQPLINLRATMSTDFKMPMQ